MDHVPHCLAYGPTDSQGYPTTCPLPHRHEGPHHWVREGWTKYDPVAATFWRTVIYGAPLGLIAGVAYALLR